MDWGEQFRGGVPDPGHTIGQHDLTGSLGETATGCLPEYTLSELRQHRTGIQSSRAFNGGRIGDRSRIAHGFALLIARFGSPDSDQFGFAGLGGAIGLLAGALRDFLLSRGP